MQAQPQDHGEHDVVIARHLKNHCNRGHRGAGAAADHGTHPDHCESRHAHGRTGEESCYKRGEGGSAWRHEE